MDRDEHLTDELREIEQRRREQLLRDVVEVLKLPAGRRLLHQLLADSGMWASTYVADATGRADPIAMAHREGQRENGRRLELLIIQADPEALIRMQVEHLEARRSERAAREAAQRAASGEPT